MKHPVHTSLVVACLVSACSGAASTTVADGAVAPDAAQDVATDRGAATDTAYVDGSPRGDVPEVADVAPATDVVASADVVSSDDVVVSPACHPTVGSMTATGECDQVQLAILRNGSATPTVSLSGRVNVGLGMTSVCVQVDSVDVMDGTTVLATLPGSGVDVPPDGSLYLLAAGPSTTALTAYCAGDANRYDAVGLVVHGRMDGGSFTTMCGNNTGDTGWPPRVVITCHTGLTAPPLRANAAQMAGMLDQVNAIVPAPPTLATVDATVHINPGSTFGGPPLMPYDSPMWMGTVSPTTTSTGAAASEVSLANFTASLGSALCPAACASPPCGGTLPPVFIARITGTTAAGTYETELYASGCVSEP